MGVPIPPRLHHHLTAARRFLRRNRFWLGLAAFVVLGLVLVGLLGPDLQRADDVLTLDMAIEMHKRGDATCYGLPPVMSYEISGDTLVLILGSPFSGSAVVEVLRLGRDVWPRYFMPQVPVLLCRNKRDDVIWIGHAGFLGQAELPKASVPQ